jgi:hypothetical protein
VKDKLETLGPVESVESIMPQLGKTFDNLWNKTYFPNLSYLPYCDILKEIIFRDLTILLMIQEKHYVPERGEPIGYFSNILEKDLFLIYNTYSRRKKGTFYRWLKEAQREYNLNQLV